jgi:hypothetical protein
MTVEAVEVALPGGGLGEVVPFVQGGELVIEDFDMGVLHHPAYLLGSVENGLVLRASTGEGTHRPELPD